MVGKIRARKMNPSERDFKRSLERKLTRDITLLFTLRRNAMGKDYEIPATPQRDQEPQRIHSTVITDTPPPAPLRRAIGFWSIPDAEAADASLEYSLRHHVQPISDDEAAAFGIPLSPNRFASLAPTIGEEIQIGLQDASRFYRELTVAPNSAVPESARAEDDSFDTERFGAEDGHAQNGIPVHPQFMPTPTAASVSAIRPRMRRR